MILLQMSSQTRLVTNHGSLKLQPFIVSETINLTQDCGLIKTGDESDFYLSPLPTPLSDEAPTNNNVIPGMQEVFEKLASRPHPSPILAATLTKFGSHIDVCQDPVANKCLLSSSTLHSHNGSDFSKRSQVYLKSQVEISSSFIDLKDFPSSPLSGAFADFQSLRYVPLSLDCSSSASISLSTANSVLDQCVDESDCLPVYSNCPPNLEEEESDLVPSELVQFVSESTRQIPSDLVDVVSAGDSDIEDIDHEARLASLCIPILRSPSLGHSHLLDNTQPPTLSPESSGCPHSPFDHIDISSDPSYEKSYFSQTPDCMADNTNKHHILSPELLSLQQGTSDELMSCNDDNLSNNIDPLISTPHVNTSNFISSNNPYTCNSDHQDLMANCSSCVMHYSTSELSEHELLPTKVCDEYKASLSTSSAETSLTSNNLCVNPVGSFTQQSIQNHFIVKDVLNRSNTSVNNLSDFQCIITNTRSAPTVSSACLDERHNGTLKVSSVVNVICTSNDERKQPMFSSKSDLCERVDSTIGGNYHQDKSFPEQIIKVDPQSTICELPFIPNLRFTTLIGSSSQNSSLANISQSPSSLTSFDQVLSSNIIRESICESNKGGKQLIVSSQIRSSFTTPNDHPFTSSPFTTSCFTENGYVDGFTSISSKEGGSVTHTPLIIPTPSFQIAPHPVSTQSTFVVSHPVTPGVISPAELQSSAPIVLSLKGRACVEAPHPQVASLSTSSGCVLLPLQIINSLPTVSPGMSILLNVKNNNVVRQNSTPCLPNFTSVNNTVASEKNGSVFLLPTPGIVTNLNGNVSNIPVVQLPTQQRVNLIPSTLSTSVLSNSNLSTFQSSATLPNSFNTIPGDIKYSTAAQLPLGTQLFILRPTSKPNIINPTYFNTSLPVSTINGAFNSLPISSTTNPGLTVVFANPNHKNFSDSGNLVFLPTVSSRSNIFPLCATDPLTSIFSTASSAFITTTTTTSLSSSSSPSSLSSTSSSSSSWTHISTLTSHDINTFVSNSTTLNSSSVTTANTSNMNFRTSVDTLNDTSLSFPLTLLPNNPQQTVVLSSQSLASLSSNDNNSNNVFISSQNFNSHAFISPSATTLSASSSSTSSSSCISFDNNSLPSPSISCSNGSLETTKSNQSVTSSSVIGSCLLPPVSSLSSVIANGSNKDSTNSKADTLSTSNNQQNDVKTSVIVLPSADKLLSSRNFSQLSNLTAQQSSKYQDVKCRRLSYSCPSTPSIPSTTVTVSTTSSASLQTVVTSSTNMVTCCSRRRHQCPYCPKSCERKDNLQAHIRTHTGERPYPCRYCPKAFPQKDHLRAHIRTHTGEKPYRCPQCLKAFAQLGNLHRHVKTHRR